MWLFLVFSSSLKLWSNILLSLYFPYPMDMDM